MTIVFSLLAILLAIIAVFTPLLPAYQPRIGLWPIYHLRLVRTALLLLAWALAFAAARSTSVAIIALLAVAILTIPAVLMDPKRIFVALNDPKSIPADEADIPDFALVIGYQDGRRAKAWPLDTVIPRHLINDKAGETPLLVAF